jgi:hypothetical protein
MLGNLLALFNNLHFKNNLLEFHAWFYSSPLLQAKRIQTPLQLLYQYWFCEHVYAIIFCTEFFERDSCFINNMSYKMVFNRNMFCHTVISQIFSQMNCNETVLTCYAPFQTHSINLSTTLFLCKHVKKLHIFPL